MKKALSMLLLLAVLACCGCSTADPGSAQSGNTSAAGDTVSAAPETTSYLSTLPVKDYGGADFVLTAEDTSQRPNFHTEAYNGEVVNDALYERHLKVGEMFNIALDYVSQADRGACTKAVRNVILSGEHLYDLVINAMTGGGINSLMTDSFLTKFNDIPFIDFSRPWWAKNIVDNFSVNGNLYMLAGSISPSYFYSAMASVCNMTMAANLGLPDIYSLVESGAWTVDKMNEFMLTAAADVNGDGVMNRNDDSFALIFSSECGRALFISAGGSYIKRNADGTFDINMVSAQSLDIADKIHAVFGSRDISILEDGVAAKIPEFVQGRTLFGISTMNFILAEVRDMNNDFGIIPLPKLNENQPEYITAGNSFLPCGLVVPITCPDAEKTGLITEALACLSYDLLTPAVYDITLQGKLAQDERSGNMLDIIYRDVNFDIFSSMNISDCATHMRSYLVGTADNITTQYAALESKVIAEFDKLITALSQ